MQKKRSAIYFFAWIMAIGLLFAIPMYILYGSGHDRGYRFSKCQMEMMSLIAALQQYRVEFGVFPSGDSSDVLKALCGDNPKKAIFFLAGPRSLNKKGELVDPWGTPYELRFSSTNSVSVRSAGKNEIFGDKDDFAREQLVR